ncbi:hypothetical protein LINPERPRIM_LOCUS37182 [Linum perenne]
MVHMNFGTTEGERSQYARIFVEVDLSKPLLGKYIVEECVLHVDYESLKNI